jgi:hypothetical protein
MAIPIKEIGDAVLLLFQTFPDVIAWQSEFEAELRTVAEITDCPAIEVRTCVHVGDVLLEGVNPIALAVSQLFKIEKHVESGDIALTDAAYHAAWPTLGRAYHAFEDCGLVDLDGHPTKVMLHRLLREQHLDLAEFVTEGVSTSQNARPDCCKRRSGETRMTSDGRDDEQRVVDPGSGLAIEQREANLRESVSVQRLSGHVITAPSTRESRWGDNRGFESPRSRSPVESPEGLHRERFVAVISHGRGDRNGGR